MEGRAFGPPMPKEAPIRISLHQDAKNPVLRGYPLVLAAYIICSFHFVAQYLWKNAGFGRLRSISDLNEYEPRWDPTVIPIESGAKASGESQIQDPLEDPARDPKKSGGYYSAADFHRAYSANDSTPKQVVKALLKAIESNEGHRIAFLSIKKEACLEAAERSTERYQAGKPLGALDGVPVAIKDEVDLAGHSRCCGSQSVASIEASASSWCVRQWEQAGAIIVGKLNMHEFGLDTTNCNPVQGTPRNPHNSEYFTGGSSGGSAYVVSSGLVPIALGCDGGGSIRVPSSYCGIYGLKPSHGRVSTAPTPSIDPSMGVAGPMTSSLRDLALAYNVMATPDPSNAASVLFLQTAGQHTLKRDKVIGVIPAQFDQAAAPVRSLSASVVDHCEKGLGYTVLREIAFPYLQEGQLAHGLAFLSELHAQIKHIVGSDLAGLQPANRVLLAVARQTPAEDLLLAQKMRNLLMRHLSWLFAQHPDLIIVSPTTPLAGRKIQPGDLAHGVNNGNEQLRSFENTWLANFTGCPAISVPIGKVEGSGGDGEVPVGLMGMSAWGKEHLLFAWAADLEAKNDKGASFAIDRPPTWVDLMSLARKEDSKQSDVN